MNEMYIKLEDNPLIIIPVLFEFKLSKYEYDIFSMILCNQKYTPWINDIMLHFKIHLILSTFSMDDAFHT